MVTVAYNAYCAISMEGDDDTYDSKTAGSPDMYTLFFFTGRYPIVVILHNW